MVLDLRLASTLLLVLSYLRKAITGLIEVQFTAMWLLLYALSPVHYCYVWYHKNKGNGTVKGRIKHLVFQ